MTKTLLTISLLSLIAFSGCSLSLKKQVQEKAEELQTESEALMNDVSNSYNNVVDKVVETKNDIDTAVEKVQEAKEAIDAISE